MSKFSASLGPPVNNETTDFLHFPNMNIDRVGQTLGRLETNCSQTERPCQSRDNERLFQTRNVMKGEVSLEESIHRARNVDIRYRVPHQRHNIHMEDSEDKESIVETWRPRSFNECGEKREIRMDFQYDEIEDQSKYDYQQKHRKHNYWEELTRKPKQYVSTRKNQLKSLHQNQYVNRKDRRYEVGKHYEMKEHCHEEKRDIKYDRRRRACQKSSISKSQAEVKDECHDKWRGNPQQQTTENEHWDEKRKYCFDEKMDHCDYKRLKNNLHHGEDLQRSSHSSKKTPLKSILKKKIDQTFENSIPDSRCDKSTFADKQAKAHFLKPFDDNNSEFLTHLQIKERNMKLSLQTDLNIDDEEEFLYGQRKTESKPSTRELETQIPIIGTLDNYSQRPISEVQEETVIPLSSAISNLPSWMKPLPEVNDVEEREKEDPLDQTVQGILKSIGFNFDLSKRMQELAKIKKQNEEESHFSINKSASFLGLLMPDMSFNENLNKKDKTSEESTTVISKGDLEDSVPGKIELHEGPDEMGSRPEDDEHLFTSNILKGSFEEFLLIDEVNVKQQLASRIDPGLPSEPKTGNEDYMPKWYALPLNSSQELKSDSIKSHNKNLNAFSLSEETEMITNLEVFKKGSESRKRLREKSPEYSRIVIAPKLREEQTCKRNKAFKHKMEERKVRQNQVNTKSNASQLQNEKGKTKRSIKVTLEVPMKNQKQMLKETEERGEKKLLLERELDKLKKHQNEIMRRRQRQKDGHKDPLLLQNSKLQEEISAQIKLLRKPTEKKDMSVVPADITEKVKATQAETLRKQHTFSDPGSHFCFDCQHISETIFDHLRHLQSRKHKQMEEQFDQGCLGYLQPKSSVLPKTDFEEATSIKGVEFMKSKHVFYCSLCDVFTGDLHSAEAHLTSQQHFDEYRMHTEQNEFYEKRYALEKTAAMLQVRKQCEKMPVNDVQIETFQEQTTESVHERYASRVQESHENLSSSEGKTEHDKKVSLENEKLLPEKISENFAVKSLQTVENKTEVKTDERSIEESKQEEITKKKIAIKLTGKTVIKPHINILPVWTPLAMKSEVNHPKIINEVETSLASIVKPEIKNPPSLDSFLSIGGPTTKKLPIYKLRPGIVRKSVSHSPGPAVNNDRFENMAPEEKADFKLLGIDSDISHEIAVKRRPPPRSQNVCLPKHISSKSSSSAEQLYTVFFQGTEHVNETSFQPINLDDIPIPPPPPLPPSSSQPHCHDIKSNTFENKHRTGQKDETIDNVSKFGDSISNMSGYEPHNFNIDTANMEESGPRMPLDIKEPGDKTMQKYDDKERHKGCITDNEGKKSESPCVPLMSEDLLHPDQMFSYSAETEDEESIHMESDFEVVDEYTAE